VLIPSDERYALQPKAEVVLRQVGLVGAASAELVDGVRQLRPEDAMAEAMLRGWRAQQSARGLRADTIDYGERLVRRSCHSPTSSRGGGDLGTWMSGR
jgi:hypothetical protein